MLKVNFLFNQIYNVFFYSSSLRNTIPILNFILLFLNDSTVPPTLELIQCTIVLNEIELQVNLLCWRHFLSFESKIYQTIRSEIRIQHSIYDAGLDSNHECIVISMNSRFCFFFI